MIESFHFIRPLWLLAFIPTAMVLIIYYRSSKRNSGAWSAVIDKHLLPSLTINQQQKQTALPFWLCTVAAILLIFSLAGPSYEQRLSDVFKPKETHFIVLDLSPSMNAVDIKPSRLKRALFALKGLLSKSFEGEVSLMVFAGEPYLVTPPTTDTKTILSLIDGLNTNVVPKSGARLDLALEYINTLSQNRDVGINHILLITDSENISQQTLALAESFNKNNSHISVIAVATTQGAPVPLSTGLLKQNDEIVIAKLNETSLQNLAHISGGLYQNLQTVPTAMDNYLTFTQRKTGIAHERQTDKQISSWVDEGIWLVLLLIPFALLAFRKGYLLCLLVVLWLPYDKSHAGFWQDLWQTNNQQALEKFNDKDYQQALEKFNDKDWQASSLYKLGKYQQALEHFSQAKQSYNEANTLAHLGKLTEAIKQYEQISADSPDYQKAQEDLAAIKKFMAQNNQQNQQQSDQSNQNNDNQQSQSDQAQNQSENNQQQEQTNDHSTSNNNAENEQENEAQQQADAQNNTDEQDKDKDDIRSNETVLADENNQQTQQTLDKLSNKPYGLLKRKFLLERAYRRQNNSTLYNNVNTEQQW